MPSSIASVHSYLARGDIAVSSPWRARSKHIRSA